MEIDRARGRQTNIEEHLTMNASNDENKITRPNESKTDNEQNENRNQNQSARNIIKNTKQLYYEPKEDAHKTEEHQHVVALRGTNKKH